MQDYKHIKPRPSRGSYNARKEAVGFMVAFVVMLAVVWLILLFGDYIDGIKPLCA